MSVRFALALSIVLALLAAPEARAQARATDSFGVTIPRVLYLRTSDASVDFAPPGAAEFIAGSRGPSDPIVVTHAGNVDHEVVIRAATSTFDVSGASANPGKPSTDLEYRVDGGAWSGVPSSTGAPVHVSAPMGYYDGHDATEYRVLLDWAGDSPGTYTLDFDITIIAAN